MPIYCLHQTRHKNYTSRHCIMFYNCGSVSLGGLPPVSTYEYIKKICDALPITSTKAIYMDHPIGTLL